MSYYRGEPPPPPRSMHERIDSISPKFYEPTYSRSDVRSPSEKVHWVVCAVILAVLILGFGRLAHNVYPQAGDPGTPEYVPTQEQLANNCVDLSSGAVDLDCQYYVEQHTIDWGD